MEAAGACLGHGHPQLHRVITLPATHPSSSSLSSSVPDWVQRSVKFSADKKRLPVSPVADSQRHVPVSPQSSDASSGSAGGADVDDASCAAAGMQGTTLHT